MSYRISQVPFSTEALGYVPLRFTAGMQLRGGAWLEVDAVLAATVGREVEYGPMLAYLLQRFGIPLTDWDRRSALASYLLTTPRPDMLLHASPHVSGRSEDALRFLAPVSVEAQVAKGRRPVKLDDWDHRDPLKPYALAALQTMQVLKRAIVVGGQRIDLFGLRREPHRNDGGT